MAADVGHVLIDGFEGQSLRGIAGQFSGAMEKGQHPIWVTVDADPGFHIVTSVLIGRDLESPALEGDTVVLVDRTLILLTENVIQSRTDEGHEGGTLDGRFHGKFPVESRQVVRLQILVGRCQGRDGLITESGV